MIFSCPVWRCGFQNGVGYLADGRYDLIIRVRLMTVVRNENIQPDNNNERY